MSKQVIYDNQDNKVGDYLKKNISIDSDLRFVSAYFTVFAYEKLMNVLDNMSSMKFLFGEPKFIGGINPQNDNKSFEIDKSDSSIKLSKQLEQKEIARKCSNWIKDKVEIKSMIESNLLHGKMYHIHQKLQEKSVALMGSSNFTASGLGYGTKPNIELNMSLQDQRDVNEIKEWFDELWNDKDKVKDVKQQVLQYLEKLYKETSPKFIYYKTLFHVFEEFLSREDSADFIEYEKNLMDTDIWKMLYDFQKDGVKGIIDKIEKYNGCILADSVGLGKTWEALAVIKYYQMKNKNILVLCPKKLKQNWNLYLQLYDTNPLKNERFNYKILSHTDLGVKNGHRDGIDLSRYNWHQNDLIVIDESHNFRNNRMGKYSNKEGEENKYILSRYGFLLKEVLKKGVNTKLLLLSATPVNNSLKDLRNQIYLITEDNDHALKDSAGINSIHYTLSNAQKEFTKWSKKRNSQSHTLKNLMEDLDPAFFKLIDNLTISRSRKQIKRFYDMKKIGSFPHRRKPISQYPTIDLEGIIDDYDKLNSKIMELNLSLYIPNKYVLDVLRHKYEGTQKNFTQETREKFLIGMMKVNLLKRLESSVHSFSETLNRMIIKLDNLIAKLEKFKQGESKRVNYNAEPGFEFTTQEEREALDDTILKVGKKIQYELTDMNIDEWMKDLKKDRKQLKPLLDEAQKVTEDRDGKLQDLKKLISYKIKNPFNKFDDGKENHKILIFTAFADTAEYLYYSLSNWFMNEFGLHSALVQGSKDNKTTYKPDAFEKPRDFNNILVNFAPRGKERDKMENFPVDNEIDLLIATDCISEGQNLQDCDYVINYDIHWNPVRIIQRFGRVDRINSKNKEIQLVNFWPTQDLNKYIKLKDRVEMRMALVDITASGDDNILNQKELQELAEEDLNFRIKQLQKLQDDVLDLEDFEDMPNLGEFSFEEFRLDLLEFIELNKNELQAAPMGLNCIVPSSIKRKNSQIDFSDKMIDDVLKPGVIFCLKQTHSSKKIDKVNPLGQYFLIYIRDNGDIRYSFSNATQILHLMRLLCRDQEKAYENLCCQFNQQTENSNGMNKYSKLMKKAVRAITKNYQKKEFRNLGKDRNFIIANKSETANNEDDFELITWVVLVDKDLSL